MSNVEKMSYEILSNNITHCRVRTLTFLVDRLRELETQFALTMLLSEQDVSGAFCSRVELDLARSDHRDHGASCCACQLDVDSFMALS